MNQIRVELQEHMGDDRSIAAAAWTSSLDYEKKQTRTDADVERVVKMLADHGHATPFESVVLKFWIRMPIATDRQHMTHRIGSHNGMSGRYRTMPTEFLDIPQDILDITNAMPGINGQYLNYSYRHICDTANQTYKQVMLDLKIAKDAGNINNDQYKRMREFMRGMLPQHNMTERVTVFNLRSFANYQRLRNSPHAQPEIRQVAQLMLEQVAVKNVSPIAIKCLQNKGWVL